MNTILIVIAVVATLAAVLVILMHKGKIKDEDKDFIPDAVEDAAVEVKKRAKRAKEEFDDVTAAIVEAIDQSGDVVNAVKGKKRRGRPRKKK
jgi:flagellar basal body-associated protein FliL|tara:strand:+ start:962 stop:1237 length:276 start_codon:yes stop_codon:yes gene_type:complete